MTDNVVPKIFWHRDLPPLDSELIAEHVVEANRGRVPGTLAHRNELWDRCHDELMSDARRRMGQEITRLAGDYAHVVDESIIPRHDEAAGEAWLHGRFVYRLYRRQASRASQP